MSQSEQRERLAVAIEKSKKDLAELQKRIRKLEQKRKQFLEPVKKLRAAETP